jgi:tetratricopeptide (TPR) repeat protein
MTRSRLFLRLAAAAAFALPVILGAGAAWRGLVPRDPDRVWNQAERDLQAGRLPEAKAGLDQLAALRPATPNDWMLRAQVASAFGRDDEASSALAHIRDVHPLAAQAHLMNARLQRRHHCLRHAEAALRRAIELQPRMVDAHKELVYLFGMQLRRREVDAEFKALARLAPLSHHDLFTWGLTHFTDWGPDIALDLESFIKADPSDRHSRLALAELLLDSPGAERQVERALEPFPGCDLDATALRIELKLNHGRIDDAIALLKNTPAAHPRLARTRGRVALLRGDYSAAIAHFHAALSEIPFDRVSLSELGKALLLMGDKSAAERYLARARRLDDVYNLINRVSRPNRENQPPDLTKLASACAAAGLIEEARGWYMLAITREPLNAEAQQALRRLNDLQTKQFAQRAPLP